MDAVQPRSFAVGDPDIFDLGGVAEEPAALGLGGIEPVNGPAVTGEDLLEVSCGRSFAEGSGGFVAEAPDGVDVVVFGEGFG